MPGHFFPAPPTFIGGRQPYAPKDGIAQSGPVPQAPPIRSYAAFVAIAVASLAGPPTFIGGKQPYAAPLGQSQSGAVASQPPASSYAPNVAIAWLPPPPAFVGGDQPYGPQLGQVQSAPVSGPPPLTQVTLGIIRAAWTQDVVTIISLSSGAPFLADPGPPVPSSYVVQQTIRQAWDITPYAVPKAGTIASVLAAPPVVSAPPITTLALLYETRAAWNPGPWPAQEGAQIAPLLPAAVTPDAPPVRSYSGTIRQSWEIAPPQPQQGARIAPLIPTADQPPVQGYVVLRSIVESWNRPFVPQTLVQIAPLLPVSVSGPPQFSYAPLYSIRASWEPSPYRLPSGSRLAPFIPAPTPPSQPPVQTYVRLMNVIRQHDIAQWWPQPQFVRVSYSTQSAIYLAKQPGKIVRVEPVKRTERLSSANRKTTGEQE